ncbi:MAG: hypothetical protein A2Z08_11195 [Deltaproteobacteria bacterium RBG_16_54_11]|jgi:hypothetical protein|nr:MAG: hypothetical protein A2Z08_11195 [Deltaproteobacteria bacterium RBG_16_54_11]
MKKLALFLVCLITLAWGCSNAMFEEHDGHTYYRNERTGKAVSPASDFYQPIRESDAEIQRRRLNDSNISYQSGNKPKPAPSHGLLPPYKKDAYGLGVWSDSTGRAFQWQTKYGKSVLGNVKVDANEPGIGMDPFGQPVTAVPLK